ncbi:MAG: hypothetical protein COA67_04085 [Lutibacter sp.]|nr:MAG: hypothetical protein COA67_04085 [Lutibacter sp.]
MKNIVFLIISLSLIVTISCSSDGDSNTQQITLSQDEVNDLKFLREEEKLARDVYIYAYDKYSDVVFNNISQSEQQHMDKILVLLNTYNVEDPALPNTGEFSNQILQGIYNDLTAQVDISLIEALKVGATIEDLDIKDIENFENRTDKSNILNTYEKLKCGSRNHMRNYYNQLSNNGVTYVVQFISASELTTIINSSNEQCGN